MVVWADKVEDLEETAEEFHARLVQYGTSCQEAYSAAFWKLTILGNSVQQGTRPSDHPALYDPVVFPLHALDWVCIDVAISGEHRRLRFRGGREGEARRSHRGRCSRRATSSSAPCVRAFAYLQGKDSQLIPSRRSQPSRRSRHRSQHRHLLASCPNATHRSTLGRRVHQPGYPRGCPVLRAFSFVAAFPPAHAS